MKIFAGLMLAALGAGFALAASIRIDPGAVAARAFLDTLTPEQRAVAQLDFDDPNRLDWHYTPRARRGVSLRDLNDDQRRAAHSLLRACLSTQGYTQSVGVMELDQFLREQLEAAGRGPGPRDPLGYHITIFGEPDGDGLWGWRFEGHHLSLNFSGETGAITSVTPHFVGANPAEVRAGRRAGWRLMADEEALGRALLESLTDEQRSEAIIAGSAPSDIILSPGAGADRLGEARGVAIGDMTPAQRDIALRLLHTYIDRLRHDLGREQMQRINHAGLGAVRFAWAGSAAPGAGHYYRLHGPTFAIEYDNTQNGANHIHTVFRDLERDFGADLLREHLEQDHQGR